MLRFTTVLIAALALLLPAAPSAAQESRPYKHPELDMQFRASDGWRHRPRPGDEGTHELVDPETGIHVLMWSTSTEQGASDYLSKMAGMMDIAPDAAPQALRVDGRDGWFLTASGTVEGRAVNTLLAVFPSGKSRRHPFENVIYIVQVHCPAGDYSRLAERMAGLLQSVRITDRVILDGCPQRLYPETYESPPDPPSPFVDRNGEVYVTVRTREGRYALVPVTVENGAPNDYARGEWGKGLQLMVDEHDFPTLARTGLHADAELERTTTITGRPVSGIAADARPGAASVAGFVAEDEDLLAVIRGDNNLVARLGLTHPELAKPLFEVFNLLRRDLELARRGEVRHDNVATLLYDGKEIHVEASASKGWQASIFSDEVRGYWSIRLRREPTKMERRYLRTHYGHLETGVLDALTEMLTSVHVSEMAPFDIMRYGFYAGHTGSRVDPVAIANLFGLRGMEEIDVAVGGDLYGALTRHY